eukprot:6114363-Pleurochrysis_carterae.AAC.1
MCACARVARVCSQSRRGRRLGAPSLLRPSAAHGARLRAAAVVEAAPRGNPIAAHTPRGAAAASTATPHRLRRWAADQARTGRARLFRAHRCQRSLCACDCPLRPHLRYPDSQR